MRFVSLLVIALFSLVSVTNADYLTQNEARGFQGRQQAESTFQVDLTFNKFDAALGRLDSVTLTLEDHWQYVGAIMTDNPQEDVTLNILAHISIGDVTDTFSSSKDYSLDFLQGQGFNANGGMQIVTQSENVFDYYGVAGDTITLSYFGITQSNILEETFDVDFVDTSKIALTYNYTPGLEGAVPEPGSLGLCAVGLGCVVLYLRRK